MQEIKLKVTKREVNGKAVQGLRQQGVVPGVVYGQGKEATSIQIDERTLTKVYHQAGTSRLVELEVEGKEPINVLFHEVQHDPVTHKILHFDLYSVRMDVKIRTEVPLHFEGEAPAVHQYGALLLKLIESVEVEALPKDLPENLELDISGLSEIEDSLFVKDLKVPAGVEVLNDSEEMVVKIEAAQETTEEELAAEEAEMAEATEVEVESEHGGAVAEGEEGEDAPAETEEKEAA